MGKSSNMMRSSTTMPVPRQLDSLPDEILIHIQSFLSFKDASKTGLLGRRWRFLSLYLLDLDFESAKQFVPSSCVHVKRDKAFKYARSVDRVVCSVRDRQPSNNTLRRFRFHYHLDERFSQKVESWLRFVFDRGVEALELNFRFESHPVPFCRFPSSIIQQLDLFPKLRLLKSLSLSSIAIDNDSLTRLLLSCEFLETLRLCRVQSLSKINVAGDVLRLKYMDLSGCEFVTSIRISAPTPDLLSLRYHTDMDRVHIEQAPLLEDLFITQSRHSRNIPSLVDQPLWRFTSQLKSLFLDIQRRDLNEIGNLQNLRLGSLQHLMIDIYCLGVWDRDHSIVQRNLYSLATLIKATPNIRYLTLLTRNGINNELKIRKEFDDLDRKFLRVIEYVGFRGRKVDLKLLKRLTNAISPVEKIIFDCRPTAYFSYRFEPMTDTKDWKRSALKLRKRIRPGVEVEFLE